MKRLISLCALMSLAVCNLPGLQEPTEITTLSFLLRSLSRPPVEISIIYNGITYKPGSTIELGSTQAFVEKSSPMILKVTGTESISIDQKIPFTIETSSIGTFDIQTANPAPDIWPVGYEFNVSVITLPDGNLNNEWKLNLNVTSPTSTVLSYNLKLLSTDVTPGAILLSGNSSVGSENFVSSYAFNANSGLVGLENPIAVGLPTTISKLARSRDNRYIFFNKENISDLRSFRVNSSGGVSEVAGSPFVGFTNLRELISIPNQDRFLARNGSSDAYYTFAYDSNGAISSSTGPFGGLCSAYTVVSPKGDYMYITSAIAANSDIIPYRLNSDGNLTVIATQTELDLSNRTRIHLKSKLKPYLYTATHTSVPGTNNFKVNKILRRATRSDGTLGQVDTYFDLPNVGESYQRFIAHPNDRFYYLAGILAGQVRIKGLKHDLNSENITELFTYDIINSNMVRNIKVSPEGKYLAILVGMTTCGPPCSSLFIHKINENGTINTSPSATITRASSFDDIEWGGY